MKYTYAYKTSDGTRHEDTVEAASRDEVFAALRVRGIKAIKVTAADGSKANGEIRGVRKRIVAALTVLIALACIALTSLYFTRARAVVTKLPPAIPDPRQDALNALLDSSTRRQVIGDAAVIEKGIRTGWAEVFKDEGDRFLASFAIPGVKAGVGTTSIAALERCLQPATSHLPPSTSNLPPSTSKLEYRQIIAMVAGMKREARAYLAAGGTLVEYGQRLTERQDAEIAVFKRAEAEILAAQKTLPEAEFNRLYEQRNDELRTLGLRPITLPEE